MTWRHTGGGCGLCCNANFPCDDDYKNVETGEKVRFFSTKEAHFAMPPTVETLAEIQDREGVKQDWEENDHMSWKEKNQ
jgi:hypothetical protein